MVNNFAFLDLGTPQLILILAIVLLLFGGKKLPELSRSLGHSVRELRNGMGEGDNDKKKETKTDSKKRKSDAS